MGGTKATFILFLFLTLNQGNDVVLSAVHANVPDKEAESVQKGLHTHYWEPWKKYLAGTPEKSPAM
ncbi:MAG TPA: hypothetical protein VN958_04695 [Chitinophagaceae bacterium]|nr:hypothetical protein [Chitinophagaceae bacterium]